MTPLLDIDNLTVSFRQRGTAQRLTACADVSFQVAAGETVGLVGGSGAGKSTVARAVVDLVRPDRGRITFDGVDLRADPPAVRRQVHLVFQDPYAALPATRTVAATVAEPLVIHRIADRSTRRELVVDALTAVHLTPVERYLPRYPHQLSGGERQRVAFARAVVTRPRLILADEPTQMLDASLRAGMADLLDELRARRGVAVLHITHDLALAQRSCDRLVVLHAGRIVEQGPTDAVLSRPDHPYTVALLDAARRLHGAAPSISRRSP